MSCCYNRIWGLNDKMLFRIEKNKKNPFNDM